MIPITKDSKIDIVFRVFTFLILSIFCGCASWVQSVRHYEEPVAYRPIAWFQDQPQQFVGPFIQAGYSEADITPSSSQWLAGYAAGRKSDGVRHPLRAQCLALKDENGEKIMFVSMDLLGVLPDFISGVCTKVKSWPQERILFSSSHTHSAPDLYGIWGEGIIAIPWMDGKDTKYIAQIQENIALAIEASANGLMPAQICFASGQAPAGITRGRSDNPPPMEISIMQVAIRHKTVTLFHYAVHPDVMEGKYITPDFVYFMREHFESRTGGRMMFVNGAVGGVQPKAGKNLDVPKKFKNWTRAREIGEILASRAIEILKNPIVPDDGHIQVQIEPLPIQIKNKRFCLAMNLGLLPKIEESSVPVYYICIGNAEILTAPGELFPSLWERIKPRLQGNPKFLFGLTNVALGYMMSLQDFYSGQHPYHTTMSLSPEIGEELMTVYERMLPNPK